MDNFSQHGHIGGISTHLEFHSTVDESDIYAEMKMLALLG